MNFLSILSLRQGLSALIHVASMEMISLHTFHLAQYLHEVMSDFKYDNGRKLVQFYTASDFRDRQRQGAIVTFNLKKANGDPIGYAQVSLSFYSTPGLSSSPDPTPYCGLPKLSLMMTYSILG